MRASLGRIRAMNDSFKVVIGHLRHREGDWKELG